MCFAEILLTTMQEQQVSKVIFYMEMFFPLSPNTKKSREKVSAESLFLMNVVVVSSFGDINRTEGLQIICHII